MYIVVSDRSVPNNQDFPNEIGSQSSLTRNENAVELTSPTDSYYDVEHHWEMNYHEAAIFLEVFITVLFHLVKLSLFQLSKFNFISIQVH